MKIARRFYLTGSSILPAFSECRWTVSSSRAFAHAPAEVVARFVIDDVDDKRASLKVVGAPEEFLPLAVALLEQCLDASTGTRQLQGSRGCIETMIAAYKRHKAGY